MGSRMLAALGDGRNRFNGAEEIQNYACIAPVTEHSGQKLAMAVCQISQTDVRRVGRQDGA